MDAPVVTAPRPGARLQQAFDLSGKAASMCASLCSRPAAFRGLQPAGAPCVCRPVQEPASTRATELLLLDLARQCGVEQHRDAMFAGARPSTPPSTARSCIFAAKSGPSARPCTSAIENVANEWRRCMPRWTPCWPMPNRCAPTRHHRCRQHRHRRLRPGAADGGAGAGRVRHVGQALHFVSNVDGHELAATCWRAAAAKARCS
jgi:glucose-6-phosphate isomerase